MLQQNSMFSRLLSLVLPYLFVVAASMTLAAISPSNVYAWCGDSNENVDTSQCVNDNYKDLADNRGVDYPTYQNMVRACDDSPGNNSSGACANAIRSCLTLVTNPADCNNAAAMSAIADNCDGGEQGQVNERDTGGCDELALLNDAALDAQDTAVSDAIKNNCTNRSDPDTNRNCAILAQEAVDHCRAQQGVTRDGNDSWSPDISGFGEWNGENDTYLRRFNADEYKKCLEQYAREHTNDENICNNVGGVMRNGKCEAAPPPPPPGPPYCQQTYPNDPKLREACEKGEREGPDACVEYGQGTPEYDACTNGAGNNPEWAEGAKGPKIDVPERCGQARVNLIACDANKSGAEVFNEVLIIGLRVVTFLVGIAAVAGLAWGAVLYSKAEDDQSKVSEARGLIRNVVIGILLYGFLVAIINWLVPGGVF